MVSALALGVPPIQHRNRQVSELGAERNQPQKGKQTEGCCLNPLVKGSASDLTVRQTCEGFLRVEGTSESLLSGPHYPRHRESKQNSDRVKDLFWLEEACGRPGIRSSSWLRGFPLHTVPLAAWPEPPKTLN